MKKNLRATIAQTAGFRKPGHNATMLAVASIQKAAERLRGQIFDTPCVESRTLSEIVGTQVFLKFENLQFTASFKERSACNKLTDLVEAGTATAGVVAMSAGNQAQGVAYHAQRLGLGLRAVIVMPRSTPRAATPWSWPRAMA